MKILKNKIIIVKAYNTKHDINGNRYSCFKADIYNKQFKLVDTVNSGKNLLAYGAYSTYNLKEKLIQSGYKVEHSNQLTSDNLLSEHVHEDATKKKARDFIKYEF